ncbi:MAG TPA: hypothetical protein VE173_14745, partial [Longimicrobiales bacterium]|nr:hypothetical protein [Longimicrobiales bacterium]
MRSVGGWAACRARLRVRGRWLLLVALATLGGAVWATAADPGRAAPVAGGAALYGGIVLVVVLVSGWLGSELRSGVSLFWIQMPGSPLLLYAGRFAAILGAALVLATAQGLAVVGILGAADMPGSAATLLLRIPGFLLAAVAIAALVWTAGGWGVRGDGWAGVVAGIGLLGLELVARLQPGWLGGAAAAADLVGFPLDDLGLA